MLCQFCSKQYENKIGYSNHVRRCPKNPDRKLETLTAEGRLKISQTSTNYNNTRWTDPEYKKRHSVSMKRAVLENPESYSSSNRGRTKQIIFDGIKFQGSWELIFYKWAKQQGLNPKRVTEGFPYVWNGNRTYFPDFYLDVKDLYIEVKGYKTDRDEAKWSQFPKKLLVVDKFAIDRIKSNCYTLS